MTKTATASRPDGTAPAIRAAIARAMGRLAATRDRKAELAASLPALILATGDNAAIDQIEADVRVLNRDVVRIEALFGELRERPGPAEQLERLDQLTVIAKRANTAVNAAKEWRDQSFPDVVRILADGARLRLSARILCAEYDRSLQAARSAAGRRGRAAAGGAAGRRLRTVWRHPHARAGAVGASGHHRAEGRGVPVAMTKWDARQPRLCSVEMGPRGAMLQRRGSFLVPLVV